MRENSKCKTLSCGVSKDARYYVNGDIARLSAKEVSTKVNEAIGRLVQIVFHKLSYIDTAMGEADIRKLF